MLLLKIFEFFKKNSNTIEIMIMWNKFAMTSSKMIPANDNFKFSRKLKKMMEVIHRNV